MICEKWKWAALICPKTDIGDAGLGKSKAQVENSWWNPGVNCAQFFGWISRNCSSASEEKRTKFQKQRPSGAGENCELFYLRRS